MSMPARESACPFYMSARDGACVMPRVGLLIITMFSELQACEGDAHCRHTVVVSRRRATDTSVVEGGVWGSAPRVRLSVCCSLEKALFSVVGIEEAGEGSVLRGQHASMPFALMPHAHLGQKRDG